MPTGYTDGILKGKIKTFPQFATSCMRAFMPLVHMKEHSFDAKYELRKPNQYHIKGLRQAKSNLKKWQSYSDKQILAIAKVDLKKTIKYYTGKIKEIRKHKKSLEKMLTEVVNWTPPTSEHAEFRRFMIEQLETTIKIDGDVEYYVKEFEKNKSELKNINAIDVRRQKIEKFTWDMEYNTEKLNKDIENCEFSNKWVEDIMKSLK